MPTAPSTATIRAWAQHEGLEVAERGRLKPEILEAYAKAHGAQRRVGGEGSRPKAVSPASAEVVSEAANHRLADLEGSVAALAVRVAKLEAAASVPPVRKLFRRKN